MSDTKFHGILNCFKGDDQVIENEDVTVELCDFKKNGLVEIGFDDRGERVYLSFSLARLLDAVAIDHGNDS